MSKKRNITSAAYFKGDYSKLKYSITSTIWQLVKEEPNKTLNLMEEKGIPAIVTQTFDEQESEVIDELRAEDSKIIAYASCGGYDIENEYDLDKFEVPFLIDILESVEKHLELKG
jgi:hypothetical protein